MSTVDQEVLHAIQAYVAGFDKGDLAMPPSRRFAILTCMDARLDPAKFAGLNEGEAHVIRNAGGRASDDAIRSLVISHKLLGTNEWFVIHHTDCGMETFTNEIMADLLSAEGKFINWLTIKQQAESVTEDVTRIRRHTLVARNIPIYGYVYNVKTGGLIEVPTATAAGKAS
jgi:carbonic anhydrase